MTNRYRANSSITVKRGRWPWSKTHTTTDYRVIDTMNGSAIDGPMVVGHYESAMDARLVAQMLNEREHADD